jgi:hypothetical protein
VEELCIKYPALELPKEYLALALDVTDRGYGSISSENKENIYRMYKSSISCIGMTPEEYETCIKWFCDIMEY